LAVVSWAVPEIRYSRLSARYWARLMVTTSPGLTTAVTPEAVVLPVRCSPARANTCTV
jgi:hypothetical protein